MDFDPLSLFTPKPPVEELIDGKLNFESHTVGKIRRWSGVELFEGHGDEDNEMVPLHILDLPILSLKPPDFVLLTVLKLLAVNEVWNFEQGEEEEQDPDVVFKEKNVDIREAEKCITWLATFCPRLGSIKTLSRLPVLGFSLKQVNSYNEWLTHIISSKLTWIGDDSKVQILKEASLRISENCGRTAQPEIIRKIRFRNMGILATDCISLKEPSLTSDNLGLKTWGSSLIFSQKLIENPHILTEPILELGAGTGLVGIVSSLLGFKEVYMTDLKEILPNLKENLNMNNSHAFVEELDWNDPKIFVDRHPEIEFKTIILSDPIYSFEHPLMILNVLSKLVAASTTVLIQVPVRKNYEDVRQNLWRLMGEQFRMVEQYNETGPDEFGDIEYCLKKFVLK